MVGTGSEIQTPTDSQSQVEQIIGRVIGGKIELRRLIGSGAMGFLFEAHHQTLNKSVAVKVLKPRADFSPLHSERFAREAQTAARFDHPNGLRILDFGIDPSEQPYSVGLHYIVMEYLEGIDLFNLLKTQGPMPPKRMVKVMIQALAALASAHKQGVIHRDIKPSNFMLLQRENDDGETEDFVKVCDFGLAKIMDADGPVTVGGAPQTMQGIIVGTPAYMSPEQAVGEPLDGRSDLYSTGVVMYEMLAGTPPFQASSQMHLLLKHVSEQPPPLSKKAPHVDAKLESIIMSTLAKDKDERCQTALDLRRQLKQWLASTGLPSGRLPLTPPMGSAPIVHSHQSSPMIDDLTLGPAPSTDPVDPGIEDIEILDPVEAEGGAPKPLSSSALTQLEGESENIFEDELTTGELDLLVADSIDPTAGKEAERLPSDAFLAPIQRPVPHETPVDDIDMIVAESLDDSKPRGFTDPVSAKLAGLDHSRHAQAVIDRAQYMWRKYGITIEEYSGPNPYWIKDNNGPSIGPLDYQDAVKALAHVASKGQAESIAISHDGQSWINSTKFAKLTGQELMLDFDPETPDPTDPGQRHVLSGFLDQLSLPCIFSHITRDKLTGRLYFLRKTAMENGRIEVHLINGQPTFVYTNEVSLQLPQLMVQKELIAKQQLPRLVRLALQEECPLEEYVGREAGLDIAPYRGVFMRERLYQLFQWNRDGRFYFDRAKLPSSLAPFATSLLAVLPDLVYRSMNVDTLRNTVWGYGEGPMVRSERFTPMVKTMSLTPAQVRIAKQFGNNKSLAASISQKPNEEKLYLVMAYILVEAELLLPQKSY